MKSMKLFVMSVATMMAFSMTSAVRADEPQEKEVQVGVNDALIPGGFDSTSDVTAVVSGIFPNSCYRFKGAEVETQGDVTNVKTKAVVRSGMCLMVLVPFTREVNLGKLGKGSHTLRFHGGDGTYLEKKINIEE